MRNYLITKKQTFMKALQNYFHIHNIHFFFICNSTEAVLEKKVAMNLIPVKVILNLFSKERPVSSCGLLKSVGDNR